jgi:hypothetical protein
LQHGNIISSSQSVPNIQHFRLYILSSQPIIIDEWHVSFPTPSSAYESRSPFGCCINDFLSLKFGFNLEIMLFPHLFRFYFKDRLIFCMNQSFLLQFLCSIRWNELSDKSFIELSRDSFELQLIWSFLAFLIT